MSPTQLRTFMKQRRWSVSELAARIPVSPRSVRYWRAGNRKISDAMAERIKSLPPDAEPIARTIHRNSKEVAAALRI